MKKQMYKYSIDFDFISEQIEENTERRRRESGYYYKKELKKR